MDYVGFSNKTDFIFSKNIGDGEFVGNQHYHNLFEIYYMESGSCSYFIDNKSYEVVRGDVILIPKGIIHRTTYNNQSYSRMLINCSKRFIPTTVAPILPSILYLYRNKEISEKVYELFKKIEREYIKRDEFSEEVLICYTHMLFFLLARNKNQREEVQTGIEYIEKIIRYIQKNYASDISLSKIAGMYCVSPEHLSRVFKKETGFGFSEYVSLVRLQHAEYMLKHNKAKSIAEVAYSCGFNDSNYFSQRFKNMYGVSPSALKSTFDK